jgi:hypothetical protein
MLLEVYMVKGLLYVYTVGDGFIYSISLDSGIYLATSPEGNLVFFLEDTSIKQVKQVLSAKFPGAVFTYVARDIKARQS